MTMLPGSLSSHVLRLACVALTAIGMSSCKSPNGGGAYASSDGGGYNPYPNGGGGAVTNSSSLTPANTQPRYAEAPPPPPPGFDRPSEKFEPEPTIRHSSSSTGTSKKKSKTKSTSTASSGKKKSGTSSSGGYVASGGSVHTVITGDTLYAIAVHNHTTVPKLRALNHMKSNVISPGQKIKVQ